MNDPSRDEDRRLADRLIEFAKLFEKGRDLTWGDEIMSFVPDLYEAAAFINRFREDD